MLKVVVINAGGNIRGGNFTITLPPGISFVNSKTVPGSVGAPRLQGQDIFWEGLEIYSQKAISFSLTIRVAKDASGLLEIVSFLNDPNAHCIFGPHITEVGAVLVYWSRIISQPRNPKFLFSLFGNLLPNLGFYKKEVAKIIEGLWTSLSRKSNTEVFFQKYKTDVVVAIFPT